MSKEFLLDVLEKFAQVTSIIVATSKIKEDLDNKADTHENLRDVLERTKNQIENLCEHSESVKKLFYKQYESVSRNLAITNGTDVNSDQSEPLADKNAETENGNVNKITLKSKPIIKVVDIQKLVDPKKFLKKDLPPPKKNVNFDGSVVVITSSDEEAPKVTKTTTSNRPNRRKAAQETLKKTRKLLRDGSGSESEANDTPLTNVTSKPRKTSNKRKLTNFDKIVLSDTSSGSEDSVKLSEIKKSNHKNKDDAANKKEKVEGQIEEQDLEWKNDPKFKSKCYVKVLRVPCEKLKEYYLAKLDLLEVNKLSDLSSLKRKRQRASKCSDSDEGQKNEKKKNVAESPKQNEQSKEDALEEKSDSFVTANEGKSDSDVTADDLTINTSKPVSPTPDENIETVNIVNDSLAKDNTIEDSMIEAYVEDALNLLTSDKEEDGDDKDSDENTEDANKKSTSTEKNNENEAPTKPNDEVTLAKEKDVDENKEGKTNNEENIANEKDDEKNEKNDDSSKDKNETEKKNDKAKKAWRKDKLLTEKLTSSDSEKELVKFTKKKEQMQEHITRLVKKRVRKAILSDSDSDGKKDSGDEFQQESSSSSESEKENEKKKEEEPEQPKPRKRVKRVKDSSSDDDNEKSTRKQIRNIWGKDSLAESTKQAEAEEKERKARIAEKQKKYNQMYENDSLQSDKVDKVILDFDEENQKELLRVDDQLVSKLKPHQASGIRFMWDACFESLERAKKTKGSGCILAHCMGLGKTLQVIALSHTLLLNSEETGVRKVLVVSPLNTVLNWVSEFKQWLPDQDDFEVFELVSFKQNYERQYQVKSWHTHGGVLVIGYDMFRNLSNPGNKRLSKKMRASFQEALVDPGPDLVVCDEGHLLKNEKTNISIAMNRIRTLRRIVLTGTPLQNNLKEYFCMVQFIKPSLLGTYKEYLNRFVNPITNGQYTDSTPHDIQIMRKRSHVLHKMLDGVVQRRDYSVLEPYLPPKFEYVLFLSLTETQIKLYQHYMDHFAKRSTDGSNRTSFLFVDFQALQRICTHPRVLLDKSIEMKLAKDKRYDSEEDSEGSLKDFINDDDDDDDDEATSSSSNSSSEGEGEKKSTPRQRLTRAAAAAAKENGETIDLDATLDEPQKKEWWQQYCDGPELDVIAHSSKLFLLFEILKECEQIGDKVLVFSQSLYSLNVIEYFIGKIHDATESGDTESVGGYSGSWCQGLDYFRLDGSSSCDSRSAWCKTFNDPNNTRARLFLISTKAGGLGINLVAANRVVIFDVSWNPSHDVQSIYRVYRFGQTKPCYIYRFVTMGTMEMKIYERQVTKQAISKRVIDEQQIDRHYNQNDLGELYKFDPKPEERPIPLVPKDVLLGELLQKSDRIFKYHEHQSLLENKEDEGLNEEERKAAWEEFENEKKQRNFISSSYGRPNPVELALASIIRKQNPTWTDIQIKAVIPTLHAQMQEQVTRGDLSMYKRVQQEAQLISALQNQKAREQFYHQQMLRVMQQQQLANAMKYSGGWVNPFATANQMPGTSRHVPAASGLNSGDIIDLND